MVDRAKKVKLVLMCVFCVSKIQIHPGLGWRDFVTQLTVPSAGLCGQTLPCSLFLLVCWIRQRHLSMEDLVA